MNPISTLALIGVLWTSSAFAGDCDFDGRYERTTSAGTKETIMILDTLLIHSAQDREGHLNSQVMPHHIQQKDGSLCILTASAVNLDDTNIYGSIGGQGYRLEGHALWVMGGPAYYAVR